MLVGQVAVDDGQDTEDKDDKEDDLGVALGKSLFELNGDFAHKPVAEKLSRQKCGDHHTEAEPGGLPDLAHGRKGRRGGASAPRHSPHSRDRRGRARE